MAPPKHKSRDKKAGPSDPGGNQPQTQKVPRAEIIINVNKNTTEYIKSIRTQLGELGGGRKINNTYLMPVGPSKDEDSDVIHLKLVGDDGIVKTTLQLRIQDLYTGGFANQNGEWFQFLKHAPAIPKSTLLPFEDSYPHLKSTAKYDYLSGILMKGNKNEMLNDAMMFLSKMTKDKIKVPSQLKRVAEAMLVIIVHCCEATRFNTILSYPLGPVKHDRSNWKALTDPVTDAIPIWVDNLVNNWGNMSDVLKRRHGGQDEAELDGIMHDYQLFVPKLRGRQIEEFQLATAQDAEDEIGIINRGRDNDAGSHSR